jgi:uncharacterized protein (TIGR03905 family)
MIYKTTGVCCKEIHIEVANGIINEVKFMNGCDGNLKGIAELAKGRRAEEIINAVSGIKCGMRGTSCPDQLAAALRSVM